jgi:hypothetical protein
MRVYGLDSSGSREVLVAGYCEHCNKLLGSVKLGSIHLVWRHLEKSQALCTPVCGRGEKGSEDLGAVDVVVCCKVSES